MRHLTLLLLLLPGALLGAGTDSAGTDSPDSLQARYAAEARQTSPSETLSAERGERFYASRHGREWSCASCHTANPRRQGLHAVTGKVLKPLAPSANPERFTDAVKVEKWFRRNCKDVLGRDCTAREKGDVLVYLQTLRTGAPL